jgi:hypothetical protein
MKIKLFFKEEKLSIIAQDFEITSHGNFMLYALARFLDDNAIPDTRTENMTSNLRYIEFEIDDQFFEKVKFTLGES